MLHQLQSHLSSINTPTPLQCKHKWERLISTIGKFISVHRPTRIETSSVEKSLLLDYPSNDAGEGDADQDDAHLENEDNNEEEKVENKKEEKEEEKEEYEVEEDDQEVEEKKTMMNQLIDQMRSIRICSTMMVCQPL